MKTKEKINEEPKVKSRWQREGLDVECPESPPTRKVREGVKDPNKKVYCENCKHLTKKSVLDDDLSPFRVCIIKYTEQTALSPNQKFQKIFRYKEKNIRNNCSQYKRKWWKFYI